MFDLIKSNRINKITATHSEKISDYMILMNIVNTMDAKKNLSQEQYNIFCKEFNEIKKRKDEVPTNSLQYEHRAFGIAYSFEMKDVPYEYICGDSTDILYMFSNMKPKYDELINGLISEYSSIVDAIIKESSGLDPLTIWAYSLQFYEDITHRIIASFSSLMDDYFTRFIYQTAHLKMQEIVRNNYVGNDEKTFRKARLNMETVKKLELSVYDNCNGLDKYVDGFINSFLHLVKIPQNSPIKERIVDAICDLADLGTGRNTRTSQEPSDTVNCYMDASEIQEFVDRICKTSQEQNFTISRDDAMYFVINVLNVDKKDTAINNFLGIVDSLKLKERYKWYVQVCLFLRIMADNNIISEEEQNNFVSTYEKELLSMSQ